MKALLKLFIPPIMVQAIKKVIRQKGGWQGSYISWGEAQKHASGYDSQNILDQVKKSLLMVKNGEAAYERDSVIFDEVQYSWPLLTALMYASAKHSGVLSVLDFGGSLGSTYYQNKHFISRMKDLSWNVVEQAHFSLEGQQSFANHELNFFEDISKCVQDKKPNVLLLSSVIQYLENPYLVLENLCHHTFDIIIIDRTPFVDDGVERITLQVVPPEIYEASYPCRILSQNKLIGFFQKRGFSVLAEFPALDGNYEDFRFKGFIMERVDIEGDGNPNA